jgi:large subunit ribosomal protein L5e
MPFVKLVKNKAYFKRYQTAYRRRREGKTDYYARQRLVVQAKNKYNTPRYRLVVRSSNKYILCQIVYSEIDCDKVITQASSKELKRYGMPVGLKNYAAAYATGLLCARRCLTKLGLAELYEGTESPDGEVVSTEFNGRTHFVDEVDEEKRPFRCVLDIGLVATTIGNRVFGALKGASDGGLDIPHNEKNFPGYDKEEKSYEAETHKSYIFGGHVAEYMTHLKEDDDEDEGEYAKVFSQYIAAGIDDENMEEKWGEVHAAIRADPSPAHAESAKTRNAANTQGHNKKFANRKGLSLKQRKDRVRQKKAAAAAAAEE